MYQEIKSLKAVQIPPATKQPTSLDWICISSQPFAAITFFQIYENKILIQPLKFNMHYVLNTDFIQVMIFYSATAATQGP